MSKSDKRPDEAYVMGPDSSNTTTGSPTPSISLPRRVSGKGHAMKGILGALRGKTYNPSTYGEGDRGGSAGGYGLPHGEAGASMGSPMGGMGPMMPSGLAGVPMAFEGGVRGGGVSERETFPGQYPYPPKKGYDEQSPHRPGGRSSGAGTVHGKPGVEGIPDHGAIKHGGDMGAADTGNVDFGASHPMRSCPHGCGFGARSTHGLARHIHKKHGGFGGLGHALSMASSGVPSGLGHGSGYGTEKEYRGETEGPAEWKSNEHEWEHAAKLAHEQELPTADHISSFERGDCGGSYSRVKGLGRLSAIGENHGWR